VLLASIALAACEPAPPATGDRADAAVSGIRYLAGIDGGSGFEQAIAPRSYFSFPSDHDAHSGFRTEWWYFTGNVFDADERHFGFELTFFRIALAPDRPLRESAFATNEIWMAHLAVTDTDGRVFQAAERLSRGAAGLAGTTVADPGSGQPVVVAVEDFNARFAGNTVILAASDSDFGLELELTGLERIVAQGNNGLDPKGPEPGNASYYFSAPRLAVSGTIQSAGSLRPVAGSAWMDREWSTSALSPDVVGWDWFALQLDDGRDLMFYRLRGADGRTSEFSGGTITSAAGSVRRLDADAVTLRSTRSWTSETTGTDYPVAWTIAIPSAGLNLRIEPRLDQQEIDLTVRYWEGAVTVEGSAGGTSIGGVGYLELAGY
jgi:predicted secreted hydrolase